MSWRTAIGIAFVTGSAAGCAPSPVALDVNFPSEQAALLTHIVRIDVTTVADVTTCATESRTVMMGGVPDGRVAVLMSSSVCDIRRGVTLPDVGLGQRAFIVSALDATGNTILLQGCATGNVEPGSGRVRVTLFPNGTAYQAELMRNPPAAGATLASECGSP